MAFHTEEHVKLCEPKLHRTCACAATLVKLMELMDPKSEQFAGGIRYGSFPLNSLSKLHKLHKLHRPNNIKGLSYGGLLQQASQASLIAGSRSSGDVRRACQAGQTSNKRTFGAFQSNNVAQQAAPSGNHITVKCPLVEIIGFSAVLPDTSPFARFRAPQMAACAPAGAGLPRQGRSQTIQRRALAGRVLCPANPNPELESL